MADKHGPKRIRGIRGALGGLGGGKGCLVRSSSEQGEGAVG